MGVYNLHFMPIRTVFEGVEWKMTQDGDRQIVEYHTPAGNLTTVTVYDEAMRAGGITITHVERYAFSGPQDYEPLCHLFSHARVEPNYEGCAAFGQKIGDRGFATAFLSSAASLTRAGATLSPCGVRNGVKIASATPCASKLFRNSFMTVR